MKKLLSIFLLSIFCLSTKAQQFPQDWLKYTSNKLYFFDIESGQNNNRLDETKFKNNLLDLARVNLSKQIQVKVDELNQLSKMATDGNTNIVFSSKRNISTNLELKFAETDTHLDPISGTHYAIVFIEKRKARDFFENEIRMAICDVNNKFTIAENYVNSGSKPKAKIELQTALPILEKTSESFFWLNVFEMDKRQLEQNLGQVHQLEQELKAKLDELEHGTTFFVECQADCLGQPYPSLQNEIKGELSSYGCNFTENAATADYTITIAAKAREYNKVSTERNTAYFTNVDATINIINNTTKQCFFQDEISVKGSHTISFYESARDGYKKISKEIDKVLKEQLNL